MKRALTTLALVATTVCLSMGPAAALGRTGLDGHTKDRSITVWQNWLDPGRTPGQQRPGSDQPAASGPEYLAVRYVVACRGNTANTAANPDALCPGALQGCAATPAPDDVLHWRFARIQSRDPKFTPGLWRPAGQVCFTPDEVPEPGRPPFTQADFRRLTIQPGTAHVQPGTGRVLVNMPTNLYVQAPTQTFDVTLLGEAFEVRATPVEYTWTVEPSAKITTTDPGDPYPLDPHRRHRPSHLTGLPLTAVEARTVLVAETQQP